MIRKFRLTGWLVLFLVVSGNLAAVQWWMDDRRRTRAAGAAQRALSGTMEKGVGRIDALLLEAERGTGALRDELEGGRLTPEEALTRLQQLITSRDHYFGGTITWAPYAFDPGRRLHSAYYRRAGLQVGAPLEYVQLDQVYDYTLPEHEWYGRAIAQGSRWSEPYFCDAGQELMVTYSAVIQPDDRHPPRGVVTLDFDLRAMRSILEQLELGAAGFPTLLSAQGRFLHHPEADLVRSRRSILDLAQAEQDPIRERIGRLALRQERTFLSYHNHFTGLDTWLFLKPIRRVGWSLLTTFNAGELNLDAQYHRRRLMRLTSSALVTAIALLGLVLLGTGVSRRRLVWWSAASSLVLFVGIGVLWQQSRQYPNEPHPGGPGLAADLSRTRPAAGVRVADRATLEQQKQQLTAAARQQKLPSPVFLPTGLLIESLAISGPNEVELTGYLWQRVRQQDAAREAPNLLLVGAPTLEFTEVMRHPEGEQVVIRWSFSATLRARFDHRQYPLDRDLIRVEMVPQDPTEPLVLVPDLSAYPLLAPLTLPGLLPELAVAGWTLDRSWFTLAPRRHRTSFGREATQVRGDLPALVLEIAAERNFVDVFVSNLIPLILVALLLFAAQIVREERMGVGEKLAYNAANFFVIAFSHVSVRQSISVAGVSYLEYFFFALYLALLWTSLVSLRPATAEGETDPMEFASNLLYWPVLLLVLYLVTLQVFY